MNMCSTCKRTPTSMRSGTRSKTCDVCLRKRREAYRRKKPFSLQTPCTQTKKRLSRRAKNSNTKRVYYCSSCKCFLAPIKFAALRKTCITCLERRRSVQKSFKTLELMSAGEYRSGIMLDRTNFLLEECKEELQVDHWARDWSEVDYSPSS